MRKMYRVFVSSTYEDLKEERTAVMQTLVSMGCLPVGMEYFQAADTSAMQYIKEQIDTCDFYLVIIAGRYGTLYDKEKQISYTENEYNYASERNIPIFAFVHSDITKLPYGMIQIESLKELNNFKEKVSLKNIARWDDIPSLKDAVRSSMNAAADTYEHLGYVFSNRTDISIPLTQNFSNKEVTDRILASDETFIFGLGCPIIMRSIEDRLKGNSKSLKWPQMQILLMDPNGTASELAKLRAGWKAGNGKTNYYNDISIGVLDFENTELRHIDYLPPYNMFIFDPEDDEKGEMIVHIAGWKTPSDNGRPALHLYKSNNATWFNYFLNQFKDMWKEAHRVDKKTLTNYCNN